MILKFGSPVTRELRPYRGPGVPRPPDAGDAFYVTSPFGPRVDGFHGGNDIGNGRTGYDLVAVRPGRVIAAGFLGQPWSLPTDKWPSGNYGGLMVVVEHAEGIVSIYAHMRVAIVKAGMLVKGGEKLGEIGDTGSAQGQAHVHFGIQAPAATVPANVGTRATTSGYGLDVDPWPLISGAAVLTTEEESMGSPFGTGTVGPGINLRSGPGTTYPVTFQTTESIRVDLLAYEAAGGAYIAGGVKRSDWLRVARNDAHWCAAAFVADRSSPLFPPAPQPPADCSVQEATIAQLNGKIARARTANAGASQAQAAVEAALT